MFENKKSYDFMLNSDFDVLNDWMFGSLNKLLNGIDINPELDLIKMSIGEPQLNPPEFVKEEFKIFSSDWGKYPPTIAIPRLQQSILNYLERRFPGNNNIIDPNNNIIPVPGTREPLHLVGLISKNKRKNRSIAIVTNPFYHAWRTGGIASGSEIFWINAIQENDFNPELDKIPVQTLQNAVIMYLCFPSNPQGGTTSFTYLEKAINLARKYDFVLAVDECYIDISRLYQEKPIGCLDVIKKMNTNLDNIIIFNSLSKRSNVPGIRAGFIVGDKKIIDIYKLIVSNGAAPVPIPIQNVAAALYDDDEHNIKACQHYDKNFVIAEKQLRTFYPKLKIPKAGFFLWLPVKDDIHVAKSLWKEFSLRVMPGSYMAVCVNGFNPGKGYLRLALVDQHIIVENAFKRIINYLSKTKNE